MKTMSDGLEHFLSSLKDAQVSRRSVLGGGAALAAAGVLGWPAAARAGAFDGQTVVFTSWGGSYQDAEKAAYCEPFAKKTGATVLQDGPMNNAKFRTMVEGGSPDWDVVDVTIEFLYNGVESGLFEKLDRSKIHTDRLKPEFVHDYGMGCIAWSYNIGFNTNLIPKGKHPTSWADVFDLKKFPGQRLMRDRVAPQLEIGLMADGVEPAKVYEVLATEEGIKRAFGKLDSIRDNVVWWETNSQSQQLLADGEVSCGTILNGRVYDAAKKGAPIDLDWGQNIQSVDYLVIPKGAKNLGPAHGLIDEMTVAENQAKLANMIAYSPTNPDAFASIDKEIAPWLSTKPENAAKGFVINAEFWRERLDELAQRWSEWKLS
ncbi:putative spermidine/putrescine transport system substrate-binding protein [Tistlia consotensis]|uniref:Putative spermidine/putrescine transport system substrate-binding protein n=1 Tax=Tistlia consotensis USBA 355 TaxID=560819 RepID=A0A1Y6C4C6_9PROT|nr:ABC transporter substrate-binding protein [Tistlia consotensis]SMF36468.1 putative spermidine/putrescine transport system substrate-binding protein [Tistlia consotensis USBA 355]SNR71960.1 putative spermidine/putrescine transport system substrate-binding protein [Tistlia consotensis]